MRIGIEPCTADVRLFMAVPILRASAESTLHFSSSDPEDASPEFKSAAFSTLCSAEGRTMFVPISRRGDVSESDD